jgi:hypothetical protein
VKIRLREIGTLEVGVGKIASLEIHAGEIATRTYTRAASEEILPLIGLRVSNRKAGNQDHRGRQPKVSRQIVVSFACRP